MVSRRSLLSAMAGTAVGVPLLSACGGSSSSGGGGSTNTITAMAALIGAETPADSNPLSVALNEYIGKSLKVSWVPNANYGDKLSVLLASGDLPQLTVIPSMTSVFVRAAEAGQFWDLTKVIGDYPNLAPNSAQVLKNASINNKVYGVYRERDLIRSCVILRKDWLDKLGLPLPNTVADFYTVAKAFKQANLGGDKDNCAWILPYWSSGMWANSPFDMVSTWFGAPNQWGLADGKVIASFETEAFLEANRFIRKMISEGLVNADFASAATDKLNQQFVTGRGGIFVDVLSHAPELLRVFKEKDPENYGNYVAVTGNLTGPNGQKHSHPTPGFAGMVAISKSGVKSESQLKDLLKVLDHLAEQKGQILLNNGLEGKNFTVRDGFAMAVTPETTESKAITAATTAYAQLYTHGPKRLYYPPVSPGAPETALQARRTELIAEDLKTAVHNPLAHLQSKTYIEKGGPLLKVLYDVQIRYLAGQLAEKDLREAISRWGSDGGSQIKNELAELQQKNG